MRKKKLEMILQRVASYEKPVAKLEQYMTPAPIAADIIFTAYHFGDIADKVVLDLGCGTGIFSIGASLLAARRVIGIDVDKKSIEIARKNAQESKHRITFLTQDVNDVNIVADTVVMNPPFGAQKSNLRADRRFLAKALEIAPVVYSLHLTKTMVFVRRLISSLNGEIRYEKDYVFPIPWLFDFHKKKRGIYDVKLLRIMRSE